MPLAQLSGGTPWKPSPFEGLAQGFGSAFGAYQQGQLQRQALLRQQQQDLLQEALKQAQTQDFLAKAKQRGEPKEASGSDMLNMLRLRILMGMTPEEQKNYLLKPGASATANVTMGGEPKMEKPTKTSIEKEILDVNETLRGFSEMNKLYQPKFSMIPFNWKHDFTVGMERWGIPPGNAETFLTVSKKDIIDLANYTAVAKPRLITFRKWATGVAFGPQEKAEIEAAFPEATGKSPTQVIAMLNQATKFAKTYKDTLGKYIIEGNVLGPDEIEQIKREAFSNALSTLSNTAKSTQSPAPPGRIRIREKKTGKTATIPQSSASQVLTDPNWEIVQ